MLTGLVQNHHPTREHANTVDTLKAVKRGTTHLRNASEFTNDPADAGAGAMPRTPPVSTPPRLKNLFASRSRTPGYFSK